MERAFRFLGVLFIGLAEKVNLTARALFLSSACVLAVSACGGGGGGSNQSSGTPPPQATNNPPSANAGADVTAEFSTEEIQLNGTASSDPDGDPLSYAWVVSQQPDGASTSLLNADTSTPAFQPSHAGDYVFNLTVTDPSGASNSDSVTISLTAPPTQLESMKVIPLSENFIDAEFDKTHDRLVVVSGQSLLVIEDDDSITSIPLPFTGQAVSISPDGLFAAVGHNEAHLSHVDLDSKTVLKTVTLDFDPLDGEMHRGLPDFGEVVMAQNGIVHGFPKNRTHTKVHSFNFETEEYALNTGFTYSDSTIFGNSKAKLRSDGRVIYALYTESSSGGLSHIERLEVDGIHLENKRINDDDYFDSLVDPVTRDAIPTCADMWPDVDGNAYLTQCFNLMRATDDQNSDRFLFNYFDRPETVIQHASSSAFTRKWYVIDTGQGPNAVVHQNESNSGSNTISVYDVDTGTPFPDITLPIIGSGNSNDWLAKFVFASDNSDSQWILAVDNYDNPQSFALLKNASAPASTNISNAPPEIILDKYKSALIGQDVSLDASDSYDPENFGLSFEWTLVSEPELSNVSPSGLNTAIVDFRPSVAGVYLFELQATDGERISQTKKVSVSAFEESEDLVFRFDTGIVDVEYSKSLDRLVYLSDIAPEVVILNPENFSKTTIPLSKRGYRISVSPDGHSAVVAHSGLATLIDLQSATVIDTQDTRVDQSQIIDSEDWGDIVLDRNNNAVLSPNAVFESSYYSINFASNESVEAGFLPGGAQMRVHPTQDWVYTAKTLGSPVEIDKLDVTGFPAIQLADSPYHGDLDFEENVWISEDGDALMTQGGVVLNSSADPGVDMYFKDEISEDILFEWADHSGAINMWAATTQAGEFNDRILQYDDVDYELLGSVSVADIQTRNGANTSIASQVFFSSNGEKMYTIIRSSDLLDQTAVQVTLIDNQP